METTEKSELQEIPKNENYFANKDSFAHVQRVAQMFSSSDLIPIKYKGNIANCIVAIEMASRIGASPLLVMQNLDIIQGKPSWSSTFLIACINSCGKFSPLRYEENDKDGGSCRAWAYDLKNEEKIFGIWVSFKMATAEGWATKAGSKWKTMPELMLRYRAAAFFSRQFCPEISMGMQTAEEVYDVRKERTEDAEFEDLDKIHEGRVISILNSCNTLEEIEKAEKSIPNEYQLLVQSRKKELQTQERNAAILNEGKELFDGK